MGCGASTDATHNHHHHHGGSPTTASRAVPFNKKLCPAGHQLYKKSAAIFTCDACKKSFFNGEPCYRCICGVDACEECYSVKSGCKGDHLMYENRMRQAFKCDLCGQENRKFGTIALSCRKCNFDICPKHKNEQPAVQQQPVVVAQQQEVKPQPLSHEVAPPVEFKPPQPPQYVPAANDKFLALFIGINYFGSQAELSGCVRDVAVSRDMVAKMGFKLDANTTRTLVDDKKVPYRTGQPDKQTIIDSFKWLVSTATPGTNVFIHYSGHGAPQRDDSRDEEDGNDECLVPVNYEEEGLITDDSLFEIIKNFPAGCRVTMLIDCCHSSSIFDLKYTWKWEGEEKKFSMPPKARDFTVTSTKKMDADVIMISGCMDNQTSADVSNVADFGLWLGKDSPGKAGGALTSGFAAAVQSKFDGTKLKVSFMELFYIIQQDLKKRKFTQVPQLSSSKKFDMNSDFTLFGPLPQP